jgi:hypothetical protein
VHPESHHVSVAQLIVGHKRMEKPFAPILPRPCASRKRVVVICTLIAMFVGILVAGGIMLSRAKATANRLMAVGRLSQMVTALWIYEDDHGALPPLCLRDKTGTPIQSWRALILPYLGSPELAEQLDLSQPWNSHFNRKLTDAVPPGNWVWFALERPTTLPISTHILAYVGRGSIWDGRTGLAKGRMSEHRGAIVLVWVPESNLHPLQPGDITEEEVRERLDKGQEILFVAADRETGNSGIVALERGELVFRTRRPFHDQTSGQQ